MPAWLLPHRCGSFGNPPASTPPLFASNPGTGSPTRWISTAKCPNDPKYNVPHHKKRGKVGGLWRSELGQKDNNVYICRTRRAKLTRFARRVPSFGATLRNGGGKLHSFSKKLHMFSRILPLFFSFLAVLSAAAQREVPRIDIKLADGITITDLESSKKRGAARRSPSRPQGSGRTSPIRPRCADAATPRGR